MSIGVLIVDDSAVVRQVASAVLGAAPGIRVLGAASDPVAAVALLREQWPDVIVLDLEMPRMDGLSFLRKIMAERPTPVVICSTLTAAGADVTLDALAAGAVAVIEKPKLGLRAFLEDPAADLAGAVRVAARARVRTPQPRPAAPPARLSADAVLPAPAASPLARTTERIVAIGTSTGGTLALETVLTALPRNAPGIVVVQHMPEKFTAAFAARLDGLCRVDVLEARHQMRVLPGQVLIAPGGKHMLLKRNGAQYMVDVIDGPLVNRHRPSVDVLFRSAARCAGPNALGIIMTGMGDDGAAGLLEMRQAGARTLAQDEASCVVFGMPKEALKRGAVERSVALEAIAGEIGHAAT